MLKDKRFKLFLLFLGSLSLIFYATHFPLPTKQRPIRFYSTHNREDLRLITLKALTKAKHSIHIYTYCLTDPQVLSLLMKKAHLGVEIHITYHEKNTPRLKQLPNLYKHHLKKRANQSSSPIHFYPVRKGGLMHAKWIVIDQKLILIGTANLTPSSLMMHDNFIIGIESPEFAKSLIIPSSYKAMIGNQQLTFFLLPEKEGLTHLLQVLSGAQTKVSIALFTFTHPLIAKTLIDLHKRGVSIDLTLDQHVARGSSKNILTTLLEHNLLVRQSKGRQLFHHKWALIDETTFVMGSANWTKAAFLKNKDFILFLSPLTKKQIKYLKKTTNQIKKESSQ